VRDSAALLDVTAGPDVGDPYWAPPPARRYLDEVGADAGRLRIAFSVVSPSGGPVHPDCAAAVRDAAALCAALGHDVDEAAPELDQIATTRAFLTLYAASAAHSVAHVERATGHPPALERLEPLTRALADMGNAASAASYLLAVEDLQRTARAVAHFFLDYDVWLTPVLAEPPVPLGTLDATEEEPMRGFFRAGELCPFTPICNVTGQPAMSVPLFWNDTGLPIGSHFAARFGDEATLFRLAAQLEAARPWTRRRPPISA